jgi:hypothetical protein
LESCVLLSKFVRFFCTTIQTFLSARRTESRISESFISSRPFGIQPLFYMAKKNVVKIIRLTVINQLRDVVDRQKNVSPRRKYVAPFREYVAPFVRYVAPFREYVAPFREYVAPFCEYVAPFWRYIAPFWRYISIFGRYIAPFWRYVDDFWRYVILNRINPNSEQNLQNYRINQNFEQN